MSSSPFLKSPMDSGLQILHDSPEAEVDIVFLHGVNGHMLTTWTDRKTSACWPRDFLPGTIPDSQILTYGYGHASPRVSVMDIYSPSRFDAIARNLLSCLEDARSAAESRPLIFVAHSLGGLF